MNNKEPVLIENLIPNSIQKEIYDLCSSNNFPWYYTSGIWGKVIDNPPKWQYSAMNNLNVTDSPGFTHMFFDGGQPTSNYYSLLRTVLYFLEHKLDFEIENIIRMRGRMTLQTPNHTKEKYAAPHFDFFDVPNYYTLVYYVNDSDGDTILFREKMEDLLAENVIHPNITSKITPKKGSGIFFSGDTYHAGNFPIDFSNRIIINYDFTIKDK